MLYELFPPTNADKKSPSEEDVFYAGGRMASWKMPYSFRWPDNLRPQGRFFTSVA
jgi:hypothetical protein